MHAIFFGETPLVKQLLPVLFSSLIQPSFNSFHNCFFVVPFSYFQTFDKFQQDRKIDNLSGKLGQERVCVLCAGSMLVEAPDNKQPSARLGSHTGLITLVP